jgi:NADH-quinone oxidoreductase subunit N
MAFLPEFILLFGALALFCVSLGENRVTLARGVSVAVAVATTIACLATWGTHATLFSGAYQVDEYSQLLKLVFALGYLLILVLSADLPDIRADVKPEYFLFLAMCVSGLCMMVSSVDMIGLVIALELSSFPLYILVPMRREREDQRFQMESAVKYIMFGITAIGVMLFGMSYLFGIAGSTHIPTIMAKLQPVIHTPAAILGLSMVFCGLLYKLAVFPFHFWTPDVYQGASNETTGLIASLPKVGAVAVLVRLVSLATPDNPPIAMILSCLAVASMFYGNLIALVQTDLKRLLGFSGIAHAGYVLVGFVALDQAGFTAALYYVVAYLFMILSCFVVISRVSRDGVNLSLQELAGLHRRSPLLAVTLAAGVFALAGLPPFAGFMGKLSLLKAALSKGHLTLVILAVVNSAIAVYYYLSVVREVYFRDPADLPPISLNLPTRALCVVLIGGMLFLGVAPGRVLDHISSSVASMNLPVDPPPALVVTAPGRFVRGSK